MIPLLAVAIGAALWFGRKARGTVAEPAEVGPLGWVGGIRWGVLRPLVRAETRRLLLHPSFLVGVALTPLMLWAAIDSEGETSWRHVSTSAALALVPLGWATIIAANLVTLRPRRSGADELLAAAPAPQPVRTAGLLVCAVPAALVAGVLAAAGLVVLGAGSGEFTGSLRLAEVGAGLLIVAGSVVLGVAVGRWLPYLGFGILAAVATPVVQARFFELAAWPWYRTEADPLRFLAFLAGPTSVDVSLLEVRPAEWHVVYLVGLVLVVAGIALARDGVPRRLGVGLGAAVAVVAVAGWVQLQPPSRQETNEMVAYLTDPLPFGTCAQDGSVRYCAPEEQLARVPDWRSRVTAVHALVPAPVAARPLLVAYRAPTVVGSSACTPQPFFRGLHPRVAARVTPADVWPDDGAVHPGTGSFPCGGAGTDEFFTAVQVGSWAVGLPPSPHHFDVRCSASGQARAVVALWLGAAATPDGAQVLEALLRERTTMPGVMTFTDWDAPPMWGVRFSAADAELAIRLAAMPKERVAKAVGSSWVQVTAPDTTAGDLAALLGIDASSVARPATAPGQACP